jgi:hypothetical protein
MSPLLHREFDLLESRDESVSEGNRIALATFLMNDAELAGRQGEQELAKTQINESKERLQSILKQNPASAEARYALQMVGFLAWEQGGQEISSPDTESGISTTEARSCSDVSLSARLAVARGDSNAATVYTSYLLDKGYYEPEFVRFCRKYGLCDES